MKLIRSHNHSSVVAQFDAQLGPAFDRRWHHVRKHADRDRAIHNTHPEVVLAVLAQGVTDEATIHTSCPEARRAVTIDECTFSSATSLTQTRLRWGEARRCGALLPHSSVPLAHPLA